MRARKIRSLRYSHERKKEKPHERGTSGRHCCREGKGASRRRMSGWVRRKGGRQREKLTGTRDIIVPSFPCPPRVYPTKSFDAFRRSRSAGWNKELLSGMEVPLFLRSIGPRARWWGCEERRNFDFYCWSLVEYVILLEVAQNRWHWLQAHVSIIIIEIKIVTKSTNSSWFQYDCPR